MWSYILISIPLLKFGKVFPCIANWGSHLALIDSLRFWVRLLRSYPPSIGYLGHWLICYQLHLHQNFIGEPKI